MARKRIVTATTSGGQEHEDVTGSTFGSKRGMDTAIIGGNGQQTSANSVPVVPASDWIDNFFLNVALGNIPGYSIVSIAGRNPDVDNANDEDICDQGGTYPFPTSAATLSIQSDNANDTSAGTGARTLQVNGLDSSYAAISETVSLNGTSTVTSANSYLRVHSIRVMTTGSGETNEGTITANHGANILAQIQPEFGRSLMAIYTVPAGKTAYITRQFVNLAAAAGATGTKTGEAEIQIRPFGEVFRKERSVGMESIGDSFPNVHVTTYGAIPEKSDIKVRFRVNQNNCLCIGGFDLLLRTTS